MGELEAIESGILSILPPVIAIILALLTKEVYSSLFVGLFSGMAIYCFSTGKGIIDVIVYCFQMISEKMGGNGSLIVFLILLGSLVAVMSKAGGSEAYGRWAVKHIKTPRGAKFATAILGLLIFIDDYFNCLTVGTVMRPLTDRHGISREKLAYLIDSTAAPICIIAPISSWAAAVAGDLGEGGFNLFVQAIPYNLYALLTIVMVITICASSKMDFGPMKKAEALASKIRAEENDGETAKGTVYDLVIPLIVLVVCSILGMAYVGGFFSGVSFTEAIGSDPSTGLALGSFAALLTALIMYLPRRLVGFKGFMDSFMEGAKTMLPAIVILVLAWSLSSVCRYMIGTGPFVSGLIGQGVSLSFLPAIVFIVAAFLSFAMGTAWGTFGILLPLVITICGEAGVDGAAILIPTMGATLAGSVFGDHCSPISDTTILSSTGAQCEHIKHVSTQIPYAITVAAVCFVGYILAGLLKNPWIPLAVSIVLLVGVNFFLAKFANKSEK